MKQEDNRLWTFYMLHLSDLLRIYYVSDTVLSTGTVTVKETISLPMEPIHPLGEADKYHQMVRNPKREK